MGLFLYNLLRTHCEFQSGDSYVSLTQNPSDISSLNISSPFYQLLLEILLQTDRQIDRYIDRQIDRQTDRQIDSIILLSMSLNYSPIFSISFSLVPHLGNYPQIFFLFFGCVGSSFCTWAFSSCSEWGLLFNAMHGLLMWWLLLLRSMGSTCTDFSSCSMWAQQLWHTGLVAPQHVGSSQTRDRTHVPCIDRQILNCCTTREVLQIFFLEHSLV